MQKRVEAASEQEVEAPASQRYRNRMLNRQMQHVMDLIVLVAAFALAYLLRFDFAIPHDYFVYGVTQLPFVILFQFVALSIAGVHTFVWRYVGMAEVKSFLKAAILSAFPIIILRLALPDSLQLLRLPLSVIIVDTALAFGGVLGVRVLRRAIYERSQKQKRLAAHVGGVRRKPVLLIGAGRAGMLVAKEIQSRGDMDLEIKGFIDDDLHKLKSVIQRIKVLGATHDLPRLVRELKIDHVVISIAQAPRQQLQRIIDICEHIPVKVRIIPGLFEILQGKVEASRIRDIEIEDLLGRETVSFEEDEEARGTFLAGKVVMVTGAGGSIGSELARQVARYHPARILLVERAEPALFTIHQELLQVVGAAALPLIADVCDEKRMRTLFSQYQPQIIFHAAAHKHVPMMETNPTEAVKNNILGTRLLGELAGQYQVETFVLISTDKAVRPTSVMGASKRVAELAVQDLEQQYATRYVAVRFGNVIGSTGSVIPIFREQIRRGGPVTVTHPDMVRYFMTIPEAAQLVVLAGAMGEGGEIFILDMGEPVRILDLAKQTISLSGLKPYEDIDIVFTGKRPGEKLYEELDMTGEQVAKTRHPKIFIGSIANCPEETIKQALRQLKRLAELGYEQEVRGLLSELLPEAQLEQNANPDSQAGEQPRRLSLTSA
ncbi:MAG: polysaccharide biosynthesis protein [Pyrinomonadaceae bacterium]